MKTVNGQSEVFVTSIYGVTFQIKNATNVSNKTVRKKVVSRIDKYYKSDAVLFATKVGLEFIVKQVENRFIILS